MRPAPTLLLAAAAAALLSARSIAWAQPMTVSHRDGLLTVQCKDAPISMIFELIEKEAGVELVLENEVKSKKLTANLTDVPVAMAVQRLLEGVGVNYIVMMDPENWGRVGKIFIGGGGGGPARSAQAPRGRVAPEPPEPAEPAEEVYEEAADGVEPMDAGNVPGDALENPEMDPGQNPEDFGAPEDGLQNPPGSSPIPDFFGQQQKFPRSNFTPGPGNRTPFGTQQQQQTGPQQPGQNPSMAPPAVFPFTDPFGRPIPIPPGMNPEQLQQTQPPQQQPQQQRPKKQQQQQ
jgi:hypothetical protein